MVDSLCALRSDSDEAAPPPTYVSVRTNSSQAPASSGNTAPHALDRMARSADLYAERAASPEQSSLHRSFPAPSAGLHTQV